VLLRVDRLDGAGGLDLAGTRVALDATVPPSSSIRGFSVTFRGKLEPSCCVATA
jgi:hypothetical protein